MVKAHAPVHSLEENRPHWHRRRDHWRLPRTLKTFSHHRQMRCHRLEVTAHGQASAVDAQLFLRSAPEVPGVRCA